MTQTTTTKQYAYKKARGFMTEQLKQVDDRPRMPDALCLKLSQSLIDDGVPFNAKIGVVDSTPVLALHLKEAGFTNLTLLNNKEARYRKASGRVWLDDVNGFCVINKIRTLTFDLDMSSNPKFDIIIGNPPYGNAANLAVKFLNRAFDMCSDVRFVMPRSLTGKPSILNRVRLDIICESDEQLPEETFSGNIHANLQVWKPGKREKIVQKTKHEDWAWIRPESDQKPDLVVRAVGTRAGCMYFSDHEDFDRYSSTCYYLKIKASPEVIDHFRAMEEDLIEAAKSCNGRAHAGKAFIVDFYKQHCS